MLLPIKKNLAPFWDTRISTVFLLGILSGLPWVMIGSSLTLWLKEAGISRTQIGYAGLIFGAYSINFLWAPLLDRFQIRWLKRIGSRRNWVLMCQLVIASACFIMASFSPQSSAKVIVLLGLVIAIASATQDIAIDAFRVDSFTTDEADKISAAAAASTAGWWSGYAGLGFIPLYLSDHHWSWAELYPLLGITTLIFSASLFLKTQPVSTQNTDYNSRYTHYLQRVTALPEFVKRALMALLLSLLFLAIWAVCGSPGASENLSSSTMYLPSIVFAEVFLLAAIIWLLSHYSRTANTLNAPHSTSTVGLLHTIPATLLANIVAPLEDFFKRNGTTLAIGLLTFVIIFKLGEAFLGRMSIVFYKEIGFSNADIATYSKMFTWAITMAAAIPCGLLNAKIGLVKGLFFAGVFMAGSNLLLAVIAQVGPDLNWYLTAVIVDGITTTWGTIAFVAFISVLCSHTFSATQYALLASLGTFGRTTLAAFSGQMVDALDGNWAVFFIITTLMVIPGLLLLLWLSKRLKPVLQKQGST